MRRRRTFIVIELKRGRTPREVMAQVLDYGSWARGVSAERLAHIFEAGPLAYGRTPHAAFADRFDGPPPAIINENHRLVIVVSELDSGTERIVDCRWRGTRLRRQRYRVRLLLGRGRLLSRGTEIIRKCPV